MERYERRGNFPGTGDLFIYHRYCGVTVTSVIYMRITDDRGVKSKFKWVEGTFHKKAELFFELLVSRRACAYYILSIHRDVVTDIANATRKRRLRIFETCVAALLHEKGQIWIINRINMNNFWRSILKFKYEFYRYRSVEKIEKRVLINN